jgi:glutamate racemase
MGLELEMFSLKALLLGCLHYLHVCDFFDPLLPQGMDIETLHRVSATVCLLWMPMEYSRKRLHTPRALYAPLYLIACNTHAVLALGTAISQLA